jgi:hypothetical protein
MKLGVGSMLSEAISLVLSHHETQYENHAMQGIFNSIFHIYLPLVIPAYCSIVRGELFENVTCYLGF